jgi:hypothetical protein
LIGLYFVDNQIDSLSIIDIFALIMVSFTVGQTLNEVINGSSCNYAQTGAIS